MSIQEKTKNFITIVK